MSRRCGLVFVALCFFSSLLSADDQAIWREYGLVSQAGIGAGAAPATGVPANAGLARWLAGLKPSLGSLTVTVYQMKDLTGALAAWEWIRPSDGRTCSLAAFCSQSANRTVVSDFNYVVTFEGAHSSKAQVDSVMNSLPNKRDSSLPAILTFIPQNGLVLDSARYILGPASLDAFAPELRGVNVGFESGAEAQVAEYQLNGKKVRLALFDYPTPEMARLSSAHFKTLPNMQTKRSGVLVALALSSPSPEAGDTLLSRVQYEAKITWNETPPPSPIKPLYQLFLNIIYLSVMLSALCLAAGLIYAGMRVYRRRYGSLEADEAMTTLHLSGD